MQINLSQTVTNANTPQIKAQGANLPARPSFGAANVDVFKKAMGADELKNLYLATYDEIKNISKKQIFEDHNFVFAEAIFDKIASITEKDPMVIKLQNLSNKYKKTLALEDKIKLLKHEEKIHWQELEHPEIGIVRNFIDMKNAGLDNNLIETMHLSTMNGLSRLEQAYKALGVKIKQSDNHFNLLGSLIKDLPDNAPLASSIKLWALSNINIYANNKNITNIAQFIKESSQFEDLKSHAQKSLNGARKYNEQKLFNSIKNSALNEVEKKEVLIKLAKNKSEKLKNEITNLLNNKETSSEIRLLTIWAAGKCKSPQNFDLIKKIAIDKSCDLQEREFALHSLAQYLKPNTQDVKFILKSVIEEKSDLSELSEILLEKSEGRYYKKGKELSRLSEREIVKYKKYRDKYILTDSKLNIQHQNIIDRALAPFAKTLTIVSEKASIDIINDTITKIIQEVVGKRFFNSNPTCGGQFFDSGTAVSTSKKVVMHKSELKLVSKHSTTSHEFNHNFLSNIMDENDKDKLTNLYKKAVQENKCLDNYAALNEREYFAQGYEAYKSVYKPHEVMHLNEDYYFGECHVRSTLKRKDPDLYNFIEYCIKKYNV